MAGEKLFELGFRIDTSPLAAARTTAETAAASIEKLGTAEERLAASANRAAAATASASKAQVDLASSAARTGPAMSDAASQTARLQQTLAGLEGRIQMTAANVQMLAAALAGGGMGGGAGLLTMLASTVQAAANLGRSLGPVGMAVGAVATAFATLGTVTYGVLKPIGEVQDKYATLQARLESALGSQYAAETALKRLKVIASETGLGFDSATESFLRFARANATIGASTEELLKFSKTVEKLLTISGATPAESSSALMQLGQSLQLGTLQGENLRSLVERAPGFIAVLAEGLGVSQSEIRRMGSEGELTATKVFDAILRGSDRVTDSFSKIPNTIARNETRISDAWKGLLENLGKQLEASSIVQWFQRGLINSIKVASDAVAQEAEKVAATRELTQARQAFVGGAADRIGFRIDADIAGDLSRTEDERKVAADYVDRQIKAMIEAMENAENSPIVKRYRDAQARFASFVGDDKAGPASASRIEDERRRRTIIDRGLSAGREFDDYTQRLKRIEIARDQIQQAIKQAQEVIAGEDSEGNPIAQRSSEEIENATARLGDLKRLLDAVNQSAKSAAPELDRLADRFSDLQEAMRLGGGVSVGLITEAQAAMRQAEGRMGGTGRAGNIVSYIEATARQNTPALTAQAAQVRRQVEQQDALTEAQRRSADAAREVEKANRAANTELEMLGGPDSALRNIPGYTDAVRALIRAQNDLADAGNRAAQSQREMSDAVGIAAIRAQTAAIGLGPTAMSRAAMEVRAREADRSVGGGAGDRMRQQFEEERRLEDAQQAFQTGREAAQAVRVLGMNAMQREREENRQRVIDATERMTDPRLRQTVATNIQVAGEARIQDRFQQQQASLEAQRETNEQRRALIGLQNDEYRVQITLLEKRRAMEAQGIDRDVIDRQLAVTEEIERQNIAYEKQRARVEEIYGIIDGMSYSAKNLFTSMFEEAFKTGEISAKRFFQGLNSMIARAGAEMMYEIGVKPFVEAGANFLKSGLQSFGKSLFPSLFPSANGSAWHPGGIQAFAMGGVVSSPTLFAFANGGRLGVMGEEGPEAIMPLRRGPDGRLGVASTGGSGDVQVTVIDQRSSGDAAPVAVQSGTGPDGRRMISILVRDEVRRAIRTGEMDAEMSSSFGASRIVQRR